jgi:hypothetical protein
VNSVAALLAINDAICLAAGTRYCYWRMNASFIQLNVEHPRVSVLRGSARFLAPYLAASRRGYLGFGPTWLSGWSQQKYLPGVHQVTPKARARRSSAAGSDICAEVLPTTRIVISWNSHRTRSCRPSLCPHKLIPFIRAARFDSASCSAHPERALPNHQARVGVAPAGAMT